MIDWRRNEPGLLEPVFCRDVTTILDPDPVLWVVTRAFASLAEQETLYRRWIAYLAYRQGKGPPAPFAGKAAPPGRSAHNYGLAIDVVPDADPLAPGLQPDWDPKPGDAWHDLAATLDAHPRLRHGRHFGDWPHIERYRWQRHKDWRAR